MRAPPKTVGHFKVRAIAGTHTVLIALDCAEQARHGLMGFGFKRTVVGAATPGEKWLPLLRSARLQDPAA